MTQGKKITLPNREEMLERLSKVCDIDHTRQKFFPKLLQHAGEEKVAQGVVMILALAIHDYTDGMPPMMSSLLYMSAPQYIDALVTDPEVAEEAKAFLNEALTAK